MGESCQHPSEGCPKPLETATDKTPLRTWRATGRDEVCRWVGQGTLIDVTRCGAVLDPFLAKDNAPLRVRDWMRRCQSRSSPRAVPPGTRCILNARNRLPPGDVPKAGEASPKTDNAGATMRVSRPTLLTRLHCTSP